MSRHNGAGQGIPPHHNIPRPCNSGDLHTADNGTEIWDSPESQPPSSTGFPHPGNLQHTGSGKQTPALPVRQPVPGFRWGSGLICGPGVPLRCQQDEQHRDQYPPGIHGKENLPCFHSSGFESEFNSIVFPQMGRVK